MTKGRLEAFSDGVIAIIITIIILIIDLPEGNDKAEGDHRLERVGDGGQDGDPGR